MKNTSRIGKREEKQIVKDLEAKGYSARRQPGSGNRAFDLQHDVWWRDSPAGALHIEDKYRDECRWKTLEKWKEGADILTVRQARGERMAFLSWKLLLELIGQNGGREALPCAEKPRPPRPVSEVADSAGIPSSGFPKPPPGYKHFQKGRKVGR